MKRGAWILMAVGLVVVAGVLYALAFRRNGALVVETGIVVRRPTFRSCVAASGEIVADRFAGVGSSIMGKIVRLAVKEGDSVKTGQILAQLDPVQARSGPAAAAA